MRGSGPVAFGSFTFDPSSDGSVLIIPRLLAGRDGHGQAWLTTVTEAGAAGASRAARNRSRSGAASRADLA